MTDDTEQDLIDAIARADDPIPPSLALAEWLKSQDDPAAAARSELIALQAATLRGTAKKTDERRCRALIKQHLDAWTDGLASRLGLDVRLHLGFVDAFTIPSDAPELRDDPLGAFMDLFEHPLFRFARAADIGVFGDPEESGDQNGEYAHYELTPLFDAIHEAFLSEDEDDDEPPRAAPLQALTLGFPDRPRWRPRCGVGRSRRFVFAQANVTLGDATAQLTNLRALTLRCRPDDPHSLADLAERLVRFEHRPPISYDSHRSLFYDLARPDWPQLEHLAVGRTWYEDWGDGDRTWGRKSGCRADQLARVLSGEAMPRLTHLAFHHTDLADDLAEAIAASPLARQLTDLSFAHSPLTERGVAALVAGAAAFERLAVLDLQFSGLDAPALARLRDALPSAAHVEIHPYCIEGK